MFLGTPEFKFSPYGRGRFKLSVGFCAQVGRYRAYVPNGAITNGASIPLIFWPILSPYDPEWFLASVVHDALVGEFDDPISVIDVVTGAERQLSWKESAQFMRELMKCLKASKWKRHLFYHAIMLKRRIR